MTECEWRHAPEARRGLWRIERKLESWVLDAKRGGSIFGARRREANMRPMGPLEMGAIWIRQHRRLCLSSLCRNLLLKVNKKVSYLNKKSLRVFEFRDSYVLSFLYMVMNIRFPFHPFRPFRTWWYSCIWLWNMSRPTGYLVYLSIQIKHQHPATGTLKPQRLIFPIQRLIGTTEIF